MNTLSAQVIDFQAFKQARRSALAKSQPASPPEFQAGWMPVYYPFGFFAAWPTFVWARDDAFTHEGQRRT